MPICKKIIWQKSILRSITTGRIISDYFFQVEICRFGCPEHCQNPASYVAREQEVSSSINENYQSPTPTAYQADVAPASNYQSGPSLPPPPPPPSTYRQPYQQNGPPQRKRQTLPQPPARPGPNKNYQVDPRGKKINGKAPEALPNPLPLQAEQEQVRSQESQRHHARAADSTEEGEAKQAGGSGIANFLGLKLPELPTLPSLPSLFGGKKAAEKAEVKAEAIPISLGVKPQDLGLDEDVSLNPF